MADDDEDFDDIFSAIQNDAASRGAESTQGNFNYTLFGIWILLIFIILLIIRQCAFISKRFARLEQTNNLPPCC